MRADDADTLALEFITAYTRLPVDGAAHQALVAALNTMLRAAREDCAQMAFRYGCVDAAQAIRRKNGTEPEVCAACGGRGSDISFARCEVCGGAGIVAP